eukprot:Blabericola_migrator_1__1963@NODE_1535_length_4328_cov_343_829148_g1009_i0_p5_GENE_NODE_1535_length_4328_cov_343_829148_g1009_i0NODE_1535_length_4328_cov_343_829148_g1009_i0_p5_ORF_typecomplete_len131_score6_73DUF3099/PF11298_8/0_33DUF3099/PF11298_8/4_4e03_NODE_1535_length_4328_cov_343_829148_g1009_i019052297
MTPGRAVPYLIFFSVCVTLVTGALLLHNVVHWLVLTELITSGLFIIGICTAPCTETLAFIIMAPSLLCSLGFSIAVNCCEHQIVTSGIPRKGRTFDHIKANVGEYVKYNYGAYGCLGLSLLLTIIEISFY